MSLTGLAGAEDEAAVALTFAVVGDSIVKEYQPEHRNRGWGQMLTEFTQPGSVRVVNHAEGGRSSKSFMTEGRWDAVLAMDPAPDFVLIQFGHNDHPGKGEYRETLTGPVPKQLPAEGLGSRPIDWYRYNLQTYVEQARKIGATPVIVTSPECQIFTPEGSLKPRQAPYATAAAAVAKELDVTLIDLNTYSATIYQKLGPEGSNILHEDPATGRNDNVHYNETGARLWAWFIATHLAELPQLKDVITVPADPPGDF